MTTVMENKSTDQLPWIIQWIIKVNLAIPGMIILEITSQS